MPTLKTRTLTAIKPHKYGTRHLIAGEEYEVSARHALALVAGKKARYAPASPSPPGEPALAAPVRPASAEPVAVAPGMEIEKLRMEAERLGIEVDGRWGMARLQYEMTKARS